MKPGARKFYKRTSRYKSFEFLIFLVKNFDYFINLFRLYSCFYVVRVCAASSTKWQRHSSRATGEAFANFTATEQYRFSGGE